jgi:hypothetical protein
MDKAKIEKILRDTYCYGVQDGCSLPQGSCSMTEAEELSQHNQIIINTASSSLTALIIK